MPTLQNTLLTRITADPGARFGKPCIRGHRITIQEILEWLSSGASQEQILADYPQLEVEDSGPSMRMPRNSRRSLKPPSDEAALRRKPLAEIGRSTE
jgi:uncharacterized protein (DUF433 family)